MHDRMRHKLDRWVTPDILKGTVTHRIMALLPRLHSLLPPKIIASLIRTWFNGWCTARRFQGCERCLLGCEWDNTDSIEHYCVCPKVTELRRHFELDTRFNSVAGFMMAVKPLQDSDILLNSLVVYATYSTVNTCRHTGRMSGTQVWHMLIEYCKLASGSHKKLLKAVKKYF